MTTPNPHSWAGGYYGPYARNYSTYRQEHPGSTPPPAYPVQGMIGLDSSTAIPSQTTRLSKEHLFAIAAVHATCSKITALPLIGKLLARDLQFRREASWMFDHTYLMTLLTEANELAELLQSEAVMALLTVWRQGVEAQRAEEAEKAIQPPPEEEVKEGSETEAA